MIRLLLTLDAPRAPISFAYPYALARAVHQWLGPNNRWHDLQSLYSIGPLGPMRPGGGGLVPQGRSLSFFVGAAEADFAVALAQGLHAQPTVALPAASGNGTVDAQVQGVQLLPPPAFQQPAHRFRTASPVLLKHKRETPQPGKKSTTEYLTYQDGPDADAALTASLHRKLEAAGLGHLAPETRAEFCRQFPSPKTKLIALEKAPGITVKCRASACPVWVTAPEEALQLVWAAGIGGSTGVGFGAVDC